jgi:hypothetical protein
MDLAVPCTPSPIISQHLSLTTATTQISFAVPIQIVHVLPLYLVTAPRVLQ